MTDVYGEFQKFLRANPAEGQKSFFAFNAGWEAAEAAQQTLAEDLPMCGVCGESVVYKDELCFECHSLKSASH